MPFGMKNNPKGYNQYTAGGAASHLKHLAEVKGESLVRKLAAGARRGAEKIANNNYSEPAPSSSDTLGDKISRVARSAERGAKELVSKGRYKAVVKGNEIVSNVRSAPDKHYIKGYVKQEVGGVAKAASDVSDKVKKEVGDVKKAASKASSKAKKGFRNLRKSIGV